MTPLTCLLIASLASAATSAGNIPLRILNPHPSGHSVAIGGVPFGKGEAAGDAAFSVLTYNGHELPSRQEVMSRYPEGSLRWLLVEFPVNETMAVDGFGPSLRPAPAGQKPRDPANPVTIVKDATGYIVSNVLLRFHVTPGEFTPLSGLECAPEDNGAWIPFVKQMDLIIGDYYPKYHTASTQSVSATVEFEQQDQLHTIIRYRGQLLKSWATDSPRIAYDLRLHVYASQWTIKAELTLANVCDDDWIGLREINVDLLAAQSFQSVLFGGDANGPRKLSGKSVLRQYQTGPNHFQPWRPFEWVIRDASHTVLEKGDRAPGWMTVTGPQSVLNVCLNEMWERHAKSISAGTDFARIALWPRDADPLVFPRGAAISHQFAIDARTPRRSRDSVAPEISEQLRRPARVVVETDRYCNSGVFGLLSPASKGPEDYNNIIEDGLSGLLERREREGLYGMFDYGDFTFDSSTDEWTNLEYDLPHGCFLHYARTGDMALLDEGLIESRHRMDVDVVHHDPDPYFIGVNCKHHVGHTGRRDGATGHAKLLLDHTWNQSFWDTYFITGERRAKEIALLNTEALMRATENPVEGERERNYGWAMFSILETARATGDARYINRIERILDDACRQQNPDGSFLSMVCDDGTTRPGGKPFMMGILMDAMYQAYEIRPATRTEKFVKGAAEWLETLWFERDRGFAYSVCEREDGRSGDNRELIGLYFAWKLTGEKKYLDMAVKNFRAGVEVAKSDPLDAAKGLAIFMRATPNFVALCHREGIKLDPDGWQLPEEEE